jgi:hypothetical protein
MDFRLALPFPPLPPFPEFVLLPPLRHPAMNTAMDKIGTIERERAMRILILVDPRYLRQPFIWRDQSGQISAAWLP